MRPVATTLLMVAIHRRDYIGYRALPVRRCRSGLSNHLWWNTLYPQVSLDVMTPLPLPPLGNAVRADVWPENRCRRKVPAVRQLILQFQLTLFLLDVAEQEAQAAINAATNLLPSDLLNPPVYSK